MTRPLYDTAIDPPGIFCSLIKSVIIESNICSDPLASSLDSHTSIVHCKKKNHKKTCYMYMYAAGMSEYLLSSNTQLFVHSLKNP